MLAPSAKPVWKSEEEPPVEAKVSTSILERSLEKEMGASQSSVSGQARRPSVCTTGSTTASSTPLSNQDSEGDPYLIDRLPLLRSKLLSAAMAEKLTEGPGVYFRDDKVMDAKVDKVARWGATIIGVKEKDGWLRVGTTPQPLYLPMMLYNTPVLTPRVATPLGLTVTISYARGLRNADWTPVAWGTSDPYCCCTIPGKPQSKWSTRVIWNKTNPEWEESHQMLDYREGDALEFKIYDKDTGKKDDFLGHTRLESLALHAAEGFEGELVLEETGLKEGSQAVLKVKVVAIAASRGSKKERTSSQKRLEEAKQRRMSHSFISEALNTDVKEDERMSTIRWGLMSGSNSSLKSRENPLGDGKRAAVAFRSSLEGKDADATLSCSTDS